MQTLPMSTVYLMREIFRSPVGVVCSCSTLERLFDAFVIVSAFDREVAALEPAMSAVEYVVTMRQEKRRATRTL